MDYSKRIIELRREKGFSQYKLAKVAQVPQTTLSNYETGKNIPGAETLKRICDALDITVAQFFLPDPFDVTNDGEVIPLSAESEKLKEAMDELQDMTDEELKLIRSIARTIKEQRK